MSHCIVTEFEDGTVAVTAIRHAQRTIGFEKLAPEELDRACWLVAAELARDGDHVEKERIHKIEGALPHYQVADGIDFEGDDVYVVEMGVVRLGA